MCVKYVLKFLVYNFLINCQQSTVFCVFILQTTQRCFISLLSFRMLLTNLTRYHGAQDDKMPTVILTTVEWQANNKSQNTNETFSLETNTPRQASLYTDILVHASRAHEQAKCYSSVITMATYSNNIHQMETNMILEQIARHEAHKKNSSLHVSIR